jgi:antitoxin (DNA-binding transcriptional repressor) of toxin-antitoxin stability system
VIIANRGDPVAPLVPAGKTSGSASVTGTPRAILSWLERYPLRDYARRSAEEIDAAIEQERRARD